MWASVRYMQPHCIARITLEFHEHMKHVTILLSIIIWFEYDSVPHHMPGFLDYCVIFPVDMSAYIIGYINVRRHTSVVLSGLMC